MSDEKSKKRCMKCGAEIEGNHKFCMKCGAPVNGSEEQSGEAQGTKEKKPAKKKSKKGWIIAVVVVLLILCCMGGGSGDSEEEDGTMVSSNEETSSNRDSEETASVSDSSNKESEETSQASDSSNKESEETASASDSAEASEADTTNSNSSDAEEAEVMDLGVLGEDCMVSDFSDDTAGMKFTFTGAYWNHDGNGSYTYTVRYYQKNEDGSYTAYDFYVKDGTEDGALSSLEEYTYEDKYIVRLEAVYDDEENIAVYDDTEYISASGEITVEVNHYITVTNMETIDQDSPEARRASGDYYYVGDTITFTNGVSYTITDVGLYTTDYDSEFVYMEVEIVNNGEDDYTVYNNSVNFYADNYYLDSSVPFTYANDYFTGYLVSEGRQTAGRFYADCSNYDSASLIEVEIGNAKVIVKDEEDGITGSSIYVTENGEIHLAYATGGDTGSLQAGDSIDAIKEYLVDFNEISAGDAEDFTDEELTEIYNNLMDELAQYDIDIDQMKTVLCDSETGIMSAEYADYLYKRDVLDLYESLIANEGDEAWIEEMRESFGYYDS